MASGRLLPVLLVLAVLAGGAAGESGGGGRGRSRISPARSRWPPGDADSRAVLAHGPAPGQGGDFDERFAVRSVRAEGSTVVLDLAPRRGQYVVSDLSHGPVLFATC